MQKKPVHSGRSATSLLKPYSAKMVDKIKFKNTGGATTQMPEAISNYHCQSCEFTSDKRRELTKHRKQIHGDGRQGSKSRQMASPSDNAKHRVIKLESKLNNLIRNMKSKIIQHSEGAATSEDEERGLRYSITRSLVRE